MLFYHKLYISPGPISYLKDILVDGEQAHFNSETLVSSHSRTIYKQYT